MNIYIASDYNGIPLGLILAENKDFAEVAFTAMGTAHNRIEEINPNDPMPGAPGKVFYILTSKIKQCNSGRSYNHWIRGH